MASELFPGQEPGEQVYLVIQEHWFYLLSSMVLWILLLAALTAFTHYLPLYIPAALTAPYVSYVNLGKNIFLSFIVLGAFMTWALYHLNIQVITDQRIVDISHKKLFAHTISELSLSKIEDVTSETNGFFGSVFGFGNVYVQTAGSEERFTFDNVPDPDKLERLILNLYDKKMHNTEPAKAQEKYA